MNINPLSTAFMAPPPAAQTAGARGALSSDFETFLRMLTTQIRNQDPLNPMEASDFAAQLATFAGVEQTVRTNQLLEGLMAQSAVAELAGLVGMTARAAAPALLAEEGGIHMTLPPQPWADDATLIVRNAAGDEVERIPVPTDGGAFHWPGLDKDGEPLPEGIYSFEVEGRSSGRLVSTGYAETYAEVIEARRQGAEMVLVLTGGIEILVSQVTSVRPGLPT